jgi:hypothetical protein
MWKRDTRDAEISRLREEVDELRRRLAVKADPVRFAVDYIRENATEGMPAGMVTPMLSSIADALEALNERR